MKKLKEMGKDKIIIIVIIGLICFVLTTVMFMQFKLVEQTDITSIENMRKAELNTELASWKEKYEQETKKYEELKLKLEEYKNSEQSAEKSEELIKEELAQIELVLGKTNVEGEGIEITLKDSESKDVNPINADDLLIIINSLKLSGAEAISINDQRIINTTDIVYINNSFIKINQQRVLSPYVIKAIGNQSYLESGMIGTGSHIEEMKKLGHQVTIEKDKKIRINKYEGDIQTKYIE